MTPVLAVRGLTVRYPVDGGGNVGIEEVDLDVAPGETVGLVGGSGAGKSTVARAVAGLVAPDRIAAGRIELDGVDVLAAPAREARRLRHTVHLVFQDPYASLPPTLRVDAAVAEPLVIRRSCPDPQERAARVEAALEAVRLEARHHRAHPHQLSGGQRQRVALARALVTRPRLLLADEPTQMLDAALRVEMVELLDELAAGSGAAVLHITHDLALAARTCARLVVLRAGRVVEGGPTDTLLAQPAHPYTAKLLAARRLHTRRCP
ncbi:MAG: ABC transporter ATP-binding protein [Pseudonocardia sp.]